MKFHLGKNVIYLKEALYYSKAHNWVKIDDGIATIGLSDYAQVKMGEVSMVELMVDSLPGTIVAQVTFQGNEPSSASIPDITIECAKSVSELHSPISGKIISVNCHLHEDPQQVNFSPYEKGWLFIIEPADLAHALKNLMTCEEYAHFLKSL